MYAAKEIQTQALSLMNPEQHHYIMHLNASKRLKETKLETKAEFRP